MRADTHTHTHLFFQYRDKLPCLSCTYTARSHIARVVQACPCANSHATEPRTCPSDNAACTQTLVLLTHMRRTACSQCFLVPYVRNFPPEDVLVADAEMPYQPRGTVDHIQ